MLKTELGKGGLNGFNKNLRDELLSPEFEGFENTLAHGSYKIIKTIVARDIRNRLAPDFGDVKADNLAKKIINKLDQEGCLVKMINNYSEANNVKLLCWLNRKGFRKAIVTEVNRLKEEEITLTKKDIVEQMFESNKLHYSAIAGAKLLDVEHLDDRAFDECHVWLDELVKEGFLKESKLGVKTNVKDKAI